MELRIGAQVRHSIMSSHDIMRPVTLRGGFAATLGRSVWSRRRLSLQFPVSHVPVCALYELMNRCWRQPRRKTKTIP